MANNTLNFLSGFGEGFLKTLQSERERKQKEQEFNQRMAFETRQMNLLDAYRNAQLQQDQSQFQTKLGQDQSQFDIGMDFKNRSLLEDARQFDLSQQFKQQEADRDYQIDKSELGLGYSNLAQRKKEFESSQSSSGRSEVDQRQVEKLFGEAQGYLDQFRGDKEIKDNSLEYGKWKKEASGNISQLLEKVGVPINGEVANILRSVLEEGDDPETKRKLLNEAINDYYKMGKITDEQKRALQLWKELGTR